MRTDLRSRPVAVSAAVGVAALAVGGAVVAPGAGATDLSCTVSSVESAPAFGTATVSTSRGSVSAKVLSSSTTSVVRHRTTRGAWQAKVRVVARVKGSAARTADASVPTSVTSTATAVCGDEVAEVAMRATATGRAAKHVSAVDVRRHRAAAVGTREHRRSAITHARKRALALATTKARQAAPTTRAASAAMTSATTLARATGAEQATTLARETARRAAESKARGRTAPTATSSPTPSLTSTSTPSVPSTPSPTPTPTLTPSPTPTSTLTPTPTPTVTEVPVQPRPLLIKHGWDIPSAAYVQANVTSMERQPYDGLSIVMPGLSNKVQGQTPVSYTQFKQALAPVAATRFTTLKHNFVMVYSTPAGDVFGDWSVPVQNFANLARAAKEAGFEGVFYDNEEYFGSAMGHPANCGTGTLAVCQAQAQLRGRQVMDAMRSQWPAVRFLVTYGPWVSETLTASNLPGVPWNDVAWANRLKGPFVVGMVASAAGTAAQVIDGGEMYTPRTRAQFTTVNAWQNQGMATKSSLVPDSLRSAWSGTVSASSAVYDRPWIGVGMDVATWRTTIANALATTDEYVWVYTEQHDWWGSGWPETPVPAEWVDATRTARTLP